MKSKVAQAAGAVGILIASTATFAQPVAPTAPAYAAPRQVTPAPVGTFPGYGAPAPQPAPTSQLKLPEGTEIDVRTDDMLTSKTATVGEKFNITVDAPIELPGGVTIPAGYKGVGTIVNAEPRGHMGKAGKLNIQIDYIKIGDKRVRLRASQASEGKGSLGSTVALTVLFGPLGLLARGADIVIPAGKKITTYVDSDSLVDLPLAPAPVAG